MTLPNSTFYVTGGALSRDAVSYVRREADDLLYTALRQGEYSYILTARQMGKSSLMVRTAARLKEEGVQVAVIDLTSLGQNLTVEQWYKGILNRIGDYLDLEEELDDFWHEQAALPPLERWMAAVQKVILAQVPENIVLFIDEIDMVRSLPFPTDEFFAGIRACYNRRQEEPGFARLTFCLLGVVAPSDLIKDSHITPFNIGRRIELNDFTLDEATTLAVGISVTGRNATNMLLQILIWTGGHPYLTQRLCAAVAADAAVRTTIDVDQLCNELFLSRYSQQNEPNLTFVHSRILRSGHDIASLLDLYRHILKPHSRVEYDPINPLCEVLRLSGIVRVRVSDRRMVVRNRIYEHVFGFAWVRQNMPGAEVERQRVAYRRGIFMASTGLAFLLIVPIVSTLQVESYHQRMDNDIMPVQQGIRLASEQAVRMQSAVFAYQPTLDPQFQQDYRQDKQKWLQIVTNMSSIRQTNPDVAQAWSDGVAALNKWMQRDAEPSLKSGEQQSIIEGTGRFRRGINDFEKATTIIERIAAQQGAQTNEIRQMALIAETAVGAICLMLVWGAWRKFRMF